MSLISTKKVSPSGPVGADLLFIGEAPGYEEDISNKPFQGDAGELFNQLLGTIGLSREVVRVTNICNYRPNNNKFDLLLGTPQLSEGISEVLTYIKTYKPKWTILLGNKPLQFIGKKKGIDKWRSSVIPQNELPTNLFCSLHPAAVLYNEPLYPIIKFDFTKLERYIKDGYIQPIHNYTIDPRGLELEVALRELEECKTLTVDIEGVRGSSYILCCGFGISKSRAICLANHGITDLTFFSSIARILENPNIEKIFQNGFGYDIEVLRLNGVRVENYSMDTMIAAHVLDPEMPKGLDFLTSIYTDEPYYKDKGRSAIPDDEIKGWDGKFDKEVLYDYNCSDVITDYEIAEKQRIELRDRGLEDVYTYKHNLIPLGETLSQTGMEVDKDRREFLRLLINEKRIYYQELLNALAGYSVNVKSGPSVKKLLLDTYNLPERRDPKTKSITFGEDAIVSYLSLIKTKIDEFKTEEKKEIWEYRLVSCKCILLIRGYRQLLSNYVDISSSPDGRVRSSYNISAATETGRGSSHKYIDGTGNNAQTWPREVFEITEEDYTRLMEKLRK